MQADAVRRAVEELDHPTADEVFMHVRQGQDRVSIGTVYRNLERLVQSGNLRMREIGGQRRYDNHVEPHAHLHCMQCDRLVDVPWDVSGLPDIHNHAKERGFKVQDHLLEVQGICEACQQNPSPAHQPSK